MLQILEKLTSHNRVITTACLASILTVSVCYISLSNSKLELMVVLVIVATNPAPSFLRVTNPLWRETCPVLSTKVGQRGWWLCIEEQ